MNNNKSMNYNFLGNDISIFSYIKNNIEKDLNKLSNQELNNFNDFIFLYIKYIIEKDFDQLSHQELHTFNFIIINFKFNNIIYYLDLKEILDLKFYNFKYFNFKNSKHLIARSGWSKQGGVEIYVEDAKSGLELYDLLFEEGKEFNVKPGCPHLIERIESALLSYGNDMDINDNPLECGLDKFVHLDNNIEFLGKDKLIKIKENGIEKKLMGVKIDIDNINLRSSINLTINNSVIGEIRSAVYSPTFNKVIGIAMINKPYFLSKDKFDIIIDSKKYTGEICDIPFV